MRSLHSRGRRVATPRRSGMPSTSFGGFRDETAGEGIFRWPRWLRFTPMPGCAPFPALGDHRGRWKSSQSASSGECRSDFHSSRSLMTSLSDAESEYGGGNAGVEQQLDEDALDLLGA